MSTVATSFNPSSTLPRPSTLLMMPSSLSTSSIVTSFSSVSRLSLSSRSRTIVAVICSIFGFLLLLGLSYLVYRCIRARSSRRYSPPVVPRISISGDPGISGWAHGTWTPEPDMAVEPHPSLTPRSGTELLRGDMASRDVSRSSSRTRKKREPAPPVPTPPVPVESASPLAQGPSQAHYRPAVNINDTTVQDPLQVEIAPICHPYAAPPTRPRAEDQAGHEEVDVQRDGNRPGNDPESTITKEREPPSRWVDPSRRPRPRPIFESPAEAAWARQQTAPPEQPGEISPPPPYDPKRDSRGRI